MPAKPLQGLPVKYVGGGNGPPVILVHGIGGSHRHWDSLFPELVKDRYQAYALDLLGHGESAKPESNGSCYHADAVYGHLANWVSMLDLHTAPIFIGHAMGAYLILTYALRNPGKVRGMVLTNPYYTPEQLSLPLRLPLNNPQLSARLLTLAPRWTVASAFSLTQSMGGSFPKEVRQRLSEDVKRSDPAVVTFVSTTQDLTPHLKRIRTRTIILWGAKDTLFKPEAYSKLVQILPNAAHYSLPGGHYLHLTHSRVFNNLVIKYLDLLSGSVPPGVAVPKP